MTSPSRLQRPSSEAVAALVALAPVAFAVVAEAAWISVLGGLIQGFGQRDQELGIPVLAVFVAAGIVLARLVGQRLERAWPVVALGLVALGGLTGWFLPGDARAALGDGPGPAFAAHPGGWVAGLAVLRGFAHASLPLAEGTATRLLAVGVPGLAITALIGGAIGEPVRDRFLADTLGGSIVFVAATVLALAFARLGAIGDDGGFDWRGNPAWLGLTIVLLAVAIVAAIPLASVAGTAISVVISLALGPMLLVGLASGIDRTGRRVLAFCVFLLVLLWLISRVFGGSVPVLPALAPADGEVPPASPVEQMVAVSLGGLLLLGVVVGVLVLIALWMRRSGPADDLVREERTIDASGDPLSQPRRRSRFGRRRDPGGAAEAYVALVDEIERDGHVRRHPAETPAEHAARLLAMGRSDLGLHLLAADYALARYGGADLPEREQRRAVGRWRRLRRTLTKPPPGWIAPGAGTTGAASPQFVPPVDVEPRRTL